MLILAAIFLMIALLTLWLSLKERKSTGLPSGQVISSDTSRWKRPDKPLYDALTGLTGRPDYLVEENGFIIPVEVKSSRAPDLPHDSHIYQLAAYCLLIERNYAKRPPHGILHYRDKTFHIEYTSELEQELFVLLREMRATEKQAMVNRSHQEAGRCARCGYRHICDQRL